MKTSLITLGVAASIAFSTPTHAHHSSLETLMHDPKIQSEVNVPTHHKKRHISSWYELRSFSIAYLGGKQYEKLTKEKVGKKYGDHGYKNHEQTFTSLEEYFGLSRGILSAFGYAESFISQPAVSWAKAQGIMQIHPTGYWGAFRQDYDIAKKLVERYVDKTSLEKVNLNDKASEKLIVFKTTPTWKGLKKTQPRVAAHLKELYSIKNPRKGKIYFNGEPSDKELETIIRHVYAPYYKGVEHMKKKYFGNEIPTYKDIIKDATKNIVLGSLIYGLGKRQLSILTVDVGKKGVFFRWKSPGEKGVRAIKPQDLEVLTYGPYNAGINATKYRLKMVLDHLRKHPKKSIRPLSVADLSRPGTFYRETRRGMYRIKRWLDHFNRMPIIVDNFVKKGYKNR